MSKHNEEQSSYIRTPNHSDLSALDSSSRPFIHSTHLDHDIRFTTPSSSYAPPTPTNQSGEPLANRIFSSENLGLVTLFMRTSPNPPRRRSQEVTQRVRLNMSRVYLKFVIEALLYLLSTYIAVMALTFCCKLLGWFVVPLTILCALQLAARNMNSGRNRLHEENGVQHYSMTRNIKGATKQFQKGIDYSTHFALRLFGFIPERLAQTSLLDRQMAHIPDYSSRGQPR